MWTSAVNLGSLHLNNDYCYPLTLTNIGEANWSWLPRNHVQVQKKKIEFCCCLFTFSVKHKIRHFFSWHSRAKLQRNKQKVCDAHAKLLFCLLKPISFLMLSLLLHHDLIKSVMFLAKQEEVMSFEILM